MAIRVKRKLALRRRRRVKVTTASNSTGSTVVVRPRRFVRQKGVHSFNRTWAFTTINQSSAVSGVATRCYTFNLGLLPSVTDFTTLFDRYRITYIKLYCYLKVTPDANTTPATASYPRIYWANDFDDSTDPANLDELFQYTKLKSAMLSPHRPVVIKLRPAVLYQVFNNLTNAQTPKWRQWVDMATTGVPHYGVKLGIENWFSPTTDVIIRGRMWFQCKDVR